MTNTGRRRRELPLLGATAGALLLALAVIGVVQAQYLDDPFRATLISDAQSYDEWARRVATNGLSSEGVFHQSPLFPIVLGQAYSAAESRPADAALALQTALSALAIALLVPLGRLLFGSLAAGVAASGIALLHAPLIFYATKLLPVPLALASQTAALLALVAARRCAAAPRRAILWAGIAGIGWGVATLARSEMLLFLPLAAWALWQARPRAGSAAAAVAPLALFLLTAAAVISPVTAHNARRGDFVLIASSAGENLFIGNQVAGRGGYTPLHPSAGDIFSQRLAARDIAQEAAGHELRPSEISAYWRRRAVSEIAESPLAWLGLVARKLGRTFHPGDPTDIYSFALERASYLPALYALPLTTWAVLVLGIAGITISYRRRHDAWPLVALVAVHLAVLLAFFVDARLRLPLIFFITPFGGLAVVEGLRAWRHRRGRSIVVGIALLTTVGLAVGATVTRPTPRDVVRLASILSRQERLDESLAVLQVELSRPRPDPIAVDQAGWVLQKQQKFEQARTRYLQALDLEPPPARARQTRTRLAQVNERLGRFEEAAEQHDRAIASGHANAGTYYERGIFRLRRGDEAGAVSDLQHATRLSPSWPQPRRALESIASRRR